MLYVTETNCRAKKVSIEILTKQQCASSQGPADLHVMNVHVLTGDVLHWNLLCNLLRLSKTHEQKGNEVDL